MLKLASMPLYINRKTRVRHVDLDCRAIRYSEEGLADIDPDARPVARIVEIPDPTDAAVIRAIRDFTIPCTFCVPGARHTRKALPFVYEDPSERDPYMDWTDVVVVVRNEPSPDRSGWVRVVGRLRDGTDVVIGDEPEPWVVGTILNL